MNSFYNVFVGISKYGTSSSDLAGSIIMGLLMTFILHPLPILIYRYAIRKRPMERRQARTVCIVDAVIVFVLHSVISILIASASGGMAISRVSLPAIVIWSFICFRILIHKGEESSDKATITETANTDISEDDKNNDEKSD